MKSHPYQVIIGYRDQGIAGLIAQSGRDTLYKWDPATDLPPLDTGIPLLRNDIVHCAAQVVSHALPLRSLNSNLSAFKWLRFLFRAPTGMAFLMGPSYMF
jgi:hypothetical protein